MRLGAMIAVLAVLAAVTYADRNHTRSVSAHASSDRWWCSHEGVRCTGFDEAAHHARWERREHAYTLAGTVLAGVIVLVAVRRGTRSLRW
jgi:hypothetical protein